MNKKISDYLDEESKTALLCTGEHFTRMDVILTHAGILVFIILLGIIGSLA